MNNVYKRTRPTYYTNEQKEERRCIMSVLREKTQVDTIFETLRDRICIGIYQEESALHEIALGAEFQVSRTPIRQALQRLAFERFVNVRKGVGSIVAGSSSSEVSRSIEISARLLDIVTDLEIVTRGFDFYERLVPLTIRTKRLTNEPTAELFWRTIKEFHASINDSLDDLSLKQMDDMLFYRVGPYIMTGYVSAPQITVGALSDSIKNMLEPAEQGDWKALFTERQRFLRSMNDLIF